MTSLDFTCFLDAAVYVGTYEKYNSGSIKGAWLKLKDYDSYEAFIKACNDLHADEPEECIELMFQDYDYIDDSFPLSDWWEIKEALENSSYENACCAYMDYEGEWSVNACEKAEELYMGDFNDDEDFARFIAEECGAIEIPEELQFYFDWEAYAHDLMYDFVEIDGHYFQR